jgi:type VI protein secretion system component VasF
MGISYQTNNRLRRKVHTAPLSAPPTPQPAPATQLDRRVPWWPLTAAIAVAGTAFAFLYRG